MHSTVHVCVPMYCTVCASVAKLIGEGYGVILGFVIAIGMAMMAVLVYMYYFERNHSWN